MDKEAFKKIAQKVEARYEMGGLSDGLYFDYAWDCLQEFFRAHIAAGFVRKEEAERQVNIEKEYTRTAQKARQIAEDISNDSLRKLTDLRRVAGDLKDYCRHKVGCEIEGDEACDCGLHEYLSEFDAWDKQNTEGR